MRHFRGRHTRASVFPRCSSKEDRHRSAPGSLSQLLQRHLPKSLFPSIPAQPTHTPLGSRPVPCLLPAPSLSWSVRLPFPPTETPAPRILHGAGAERPREKLTWRRASLSRDLDGGSRHSPPLLSRLPFAECESGAGCLASRHWPSWAP